jgi:hypothetical protein
MNFDPDYDVVAKRSISKQIIAEMFTSFLNRLTEKDEGYRDLCLFVVPSSYDFVVIQSNQLSIAIKQTTDDDLYLHPQRVESINNLGLDGNSIIGITRLTFQRGLNVVPLDSRIVPEETH